MRRVVIRTSASASPIFNSDVNTQEARLGVSASLRSSSPHDKIRRLCHSASEISCCRDDPRILIADDSPLVVSMLVQDAGGGRLSASSEARDGLEAVEKAMTEDVDLVILDVDHASPERLPGLPPPQERSPRTRDLPVVILTSTRPGRRPLLGHADGRGLLHHQGLRAPAHPELGEAHRSPAIRARPRPAHGRLQAALVDLLSRVNDLLDRKLYEATILSGDRPRGAQPRAASTRPSPPSWRLVGRVVDFTVGGMAFARRGRRSRSCCS